MSKKDVSIVEETITEEIVNEEIIEKPTSTVGGTVVNCKRLNVRRKPHKNSKVTLIIDLGDKVEVNLDESTNDFYSVILETHACSNHKGFCMKEFIELD